MHTRMRRRVESMIQVKSPSFAVDFACSVFSLVENNFFKV
jgi:hypothetical protein